MNVSPRSGTTRLPTAVLAAWLSTRAGLLLLAWAGLRFFPGARLGREWRAFPEQLWIDGWARWDSGWYWSIVSHGYSFSEGSQCNVAFFPLFPLASSALSALLRPWLPANQAFFAAGIVLSHAAFLLACVGVHRIGEEVLGTRAANRAVWLLCLFPFALFFSAAYTESLYLALAVWAFVFARQRRWVLACLLAGLCAATRVPGVLVGAALAIEYLNQKGFSRRALDRDALAFLLVPLFFLLFLAYLQVELGDPFVFAKAQAAWGRTGPEVLLQHVSNTLSGRGRIERVALNTWVLGAVLAALPLGVSAWRRLGASYGFWALASLAIGVSTGLKSTGRYIAVLFPLFLMLGIATGRRAIFLTVAAVFGLFQAVFAYYFTNWYLVN